MTTTEDHDLGALSRCFVLAEWLVYVRGLLCLRPRSGIEGVAAPRLIWLLTLTRPWALSQLDPIPSVDQNETMLKVLTAR